MKFSHGTDQINHDMVIVKVAVFSGIFNRLRVDENSAALDNNFRPVHRGEVYLLHVANAPEQHLQPVPSHFRSNIVRHMIHFIFVSVQWQIDYLPISHLVNVKSIIIKITSKSRKNVCKQSLIIAIFQDRTN